MATTIDGHTINYKSGDFLMATKAWKGTYKGQLERKQITVKRLHKIAFSEKPIRCLADAAMREGVKQLLNEIK